jgi:hypothetical protein
MSEQLRLCRFSTTEVVWMYHAHQADKAIAAETLSRPALVYEVCMRRPRGFPKSLPLMPHAPSVG